MRRMGLCIGLKADKVAEYKRLHAAVWPGVLATIAACQIRNFSIFLKEPENLLFAYWEYHGSDFAADAARMGLWSILVFGIKRRPDPRPLERVRRRGSIRRRSPGRDAPSRPAGASAARRTWRA